MKPTTRMVVDIGHRCNIDCLHCYHKHEVSRDEKPFLSPVEILSEIEKGYYRGCDYVDFTGGEPTLCTHLPEIIKKIKEKWDMRSCVITNATTGVKSLYNFINAGVDDWLISIHGMEQTHDAFVQLPGARKRQVEFIENLLAAGGTFRANFCITKYNQHEIEEVARWLSQYPVRIVNFINFNPHHGWQKDKQGVLDTIANLLEAQLQLDAAIKHLEENGIGVNVRYYPMCRIAKEYRRCVCNDLHVVFDPYEWDYCITPKTTEAHLVWSYNATNGIELKTYPCHACSLQYICGGVNKLFFEAAGRDCVAPIVDAEVEVKDKFDFYFYRKQNTPTLEKR